MGSEGSPRVFQRLPRASKDFVTLSAAIAGLCPAKHVESELLGLIDGPLGCLRVQILWFSIFTSCFLFLAEKYKNMT